MITKDINEKIYPIERNNIVGQAFRLSYNIVNPNVFWPKCFSHGNTAIQYR